MMNWITTSVFAEIVSLSERAARLALENATEGKTWHGHALDVSKIGGQGGNAGKQYVVRVSSLPAEIQQKVKEYFRDSIDPKSLRIDENGLAEHNWKVDVIRPILAQPKGSAERQAEYMRLAGTERMGWRGKPIKLAFSTLKYWVNRYETHDGMLLCLAKVVRSDKGKGRVLVSREWEKAVPFDRHTRETIHNDLKTHVQALIAEGTQRKQGRILTAEKLKDMTAAYGFIINDPATAAEAFKIPLDFWRDEYRFKAVYRHKVDRKGSEDDAPRIRRTIDGENPLAPMECVVMDVHHINVLVRREDGTTATPKMLAFLDVATNRVFCEIVFFEENGGVRNHDLIQAIINMFRHPAFGVPQYLYCDNGAVSKCRRQGVSAMNDLRNIKDFGKTDGKTVRIEVFRPGTFTPMHGQPMTYSAADLRAAADVYDKDTAPAPVVVGHPAIDAPAYAWAEGFEYDATTERLYADVGDINPAFADAVRKGSYRKVSLSFHHPESPVNPAPGSWYPKHIGFLGGASPAVTGLKNIRFGSGDEADAVTFTADVAAPAAPFRAAFSAPSSVPSVPLSGQSFNQPAQPAAPLQSAPAFAAREATFAEREAEFAAREAEWAKREAEFAHRENDAFVEKLIDEGRLLPVHKTRYLCILDAASAGATVSFTEGGEPVAMAQALRDVLAEQPTVVHYGALDLGPDPFAGEAPPAPLTVPKGYTADPKQRDLYDRARTIEREKGVSFEQAVDMAKSR